MPFCTPVMLSKAQIMGFKAQIVVNKVSSNDAHSEGIITNVAMICNRNISLKAQGNRSPYSAKLFRFK